MMRLTNLSIRNFRSVAEADIPLSTFVCIVGHNNAGKSTILMALSLFRSGSALKPTDFYDRAREVTLEVRIEGVTDALLEPLGVHADRIREVLVDGALTLVRRYGLDGKSKLNCRKMVPSEERFTEENISTLLSGARGVQLIERMSDRFPELAERLADERPSTHGACKAMVAELIQTLAADQLEYREVDLPTGIPTSIEKLLPEVLYIPAVKDATDEVKTKEASSFGRIIKVLLDLVEGAEELADISKSLSRLEGYLNRGGVGEDGNVIDERMDAVKKMEQRVQQFVQEQFRHVNVELEIPPPDLKTIFSSAKLYLDDGVRSEIETKGDGLKRAVTFSLLRTFVEMRRDHATVTAASPTPEPRYLFLFEEPELYLHPNAQRILYDALREIAASHQVCVCTHSPYFFSAAASGTYIRVNKQEADAGGPPRSQSLHINLLDDLSFKDSFQIICFENNNAAFFCDRVVLVEGDCDVIYLKHLCKTLRAEWNFDRLNIGVVKVGGKGSFKRYRKFFQSFGVDVRVVADLDALIDDFDKLGASDGAARIRATLLQSIDELAEATQDVELKKSQIRDITGKRTFRDRYVQCREIARAISGGRAPTPEEAEFFGKLFEEEQTYIRRNLLAERPELAERKRELLAALLAEGIVVLSKGAIEMYYPEGVEGDDKPTKALAACKLIDTAEAVRALCGNGGGGENELEAAFERLFA
jgi:energy-coupling factor transporter ATP-binding protein EcfA2